MRSREGTLPRRGASPVCTPRAHHPVNQRILTGIDCGKDKAHLRLRRAYITSPLTASIRLYMYHIATTVRITVAPITEYLIAFVVVGSSSPVEPS